MVPAFLALFYGLVTFIFYVINFKNVLSSFFLYSLIFGLIEYLRGNILTGFPWNLIVYSFSENISFLSLLSVIGTYSFNLIAISFFSAPAIYILKKSKKEIIVCILILLLPIFFFTHGLYYKKKFLSNETEKNSILIRVIGSSISLNRFYDNNQTEKIIRELIKLSSPDHNQKTFFLWPEGIIPNIYQDELYSYNSLFSKNFGENHQIGFGVTSRSSIGNNYKYFNSFSVFDNNLNLIQNYNKNNLVPFGEFLPLENILNKIGLKTITNNFGSFDKGDSRNVISIKSGSDQFKFLPLICYEIIYSGNLSKDLNYNFIFNISEDGWFGKSIGPKQHFAHSIFRAIENGKYILRSANNGMTAIINPLGEIEEKIDFGEDGFIDFKESRSHPRTIFSTYGNKIFLILILLYIFIIFSFNRIKNE